MRLSLLFSSFLIIHLVYGFSSRSAVVATAFRPKITLSLFFFQPSTSTTRSSTNNSCSGHYYPLHWGRSNQTPPPAQPPQRKAIRLAASVAPGGSGESGIVKKTCPFTATMKALSSLWAVVGVVYILSKAIVRVLPIALEPFQDGAVPLKQWQLGLYIVTCLWFAYVEGYKGFQTKFSPLVVKRAFTLVPGKSNILHILLAPMYSMGLFHADRKRLIVSWSVTIGVAAIVAAVKRFPYPYRNIIDAGVVAGLTWGSISILVLYIKAWVTGKLPAIDPSLPVAAIAKKS